MTGEKILNYRIENFTEENQLFRSFTATHTQFSKKVLVKALKALESNLEKANFVQEIQQLATVQHPRILTLYDHLETSEDFFLVFEYIEGKNLQEYVEFETGPVPEKKARSFMLDILAALEFTQEKGIYNGAIHPNNIILESSGEIKILDLALSKVYKKKLIETQDPKYLSFLSPEDLQGEGSDIRRDVYSLGVLLFYLLTGKNPYDGFNAEEVKIRIKNESLPPVTKYYPMVSPEIQALISKATEKNPGDRFNSIQALRQALEALPEARVKVAQEPSQEAAEEETDSVEIPQEEYTKLNLPLVLLLLILFVFSVLSLRYSWRESDQNSEILYEIKNTDRIEAMQDSIARAQERKAIEDSLRVFGSLNRVDTSEIYIHKVERGENLTKIAKRFYQPLDTLKRLNGMTGKERLKPKEGVKVPIRTIYKVQRGENLFTVANKFKISANILREVNRLYAQTPEPGEEPQPVIYEGKDIIIPMMTKSK